MVAGYCSCGDGECEKSKSFYLRRCWDWIWAKLSHQGVYELQERAMKSLCLVYSVPSEVLLEATDSLGRDTFLGGQGVIFIPPYDIH